MNKFSLQPLYCVHVCNTRARVCVCVCTRFSDASLCMRVRVCACLALCICVCMSSVHVCVSSCPCLAVSLRVSVFSARVRGEPKVNSALLYSQLPVKLIKWVVFYKKNFKKWVHLMPLDSTKAEKNTIIH